MATRKFTRALDDDDGLPESPGAEPPRAIHHNAALGVNDTGGGLDTAAPRLRDIEASGIKCAAEPEEGAPIAIEFQRTREFIRAQSRKVVAAMETEQTTPFARAYIGGEDLVSPQ
ncbi:hypothetical protein DB30_07915 [Enhygromyxa salina]|uniref:Uncharacterized protein n=1 Tax=Enhygromyxa salina TaxID=215803 RepID=A0A0C1Z7G3_9BACT|nr:hypothetical protein DB30_07915 [Enhygromyxa salina]